MPMPWRVPMKIWSSPPVMRTESSSSPSSMLIAMIPPERTFEYAESAVFLTRPFFVANTR